MSDRIRLTPTPTNLSVWTQTFVPALMLWWWDDSAVPFREKAVRVIPRAVSKSDPVNGDIVYVNAFHAWAMSPSVTRIIVDDGGWFAALSQNDQAYARLLQVRFKRGMCVPGDRFGEFFPRVRHAVIDSTVVLDLALWMSLPQEAKVAVVGSELAEWDRDTAFEVPGNTPVHIERIANGFIHQEGVNCLSVTAYAISGNREDLYQWMFPETFSEILQRCGYVEKQGDLAPGDVLVFRDGERNIVHAAYVLAPDRILNKNGQSTFNPVTVTDLATLTADWRAYSMTILRRL